MRCEKYDDSPLETHVCKTCNGTGRLETHSYEETMGDVVTTRKEQRCPICFGQGKILQRYIY